MHYGIPPQLLPFSSVRLDVLHLSHSVTKRLMGCLRFYINKLSQKSRRMFYDHMLGYKGWKQAHVLIWKLNKKFNLLTGNELRVFTTNAGDIADGYKRIDFLLNKNPKWMLYVWL